MPCIMRGEVRIICVIICGDAFGDVAIMFVLLVLLLSEPRYTKCA